MFSILTEPSFPKAAIGIEQDAVTALALGREGKGRYRIDRAATIETPVNLITPGFVERNIANASEFRVILEDAVGSAGLMKQRNWSVTLPSNTARSAILVLDSDVPGTNLEEVIDWKAEQSFGVPAAELRITRHKIADSAEGRPRWFATAVKLAVIDEYETVFESLGWKAGLILPKAVGETRWLMAEKNAPDSLLISEQNDGFTAMLMRNNEPAVVRSVTCAPAEIDDEIYRLMMFYHDRFALNSTSVLERLLVIGKSFVPARIREISADALGNAIDTMRAEDIGLSLPAGSFTLDDVAAPAGLASYGFR
jgi:Tfp pilus assembly PilM family ATPase